MPRNFYLVQRVHESPYQRHRAAFPQAKVKSNPFGYGRMGDYELDYMGSAEFEFGAIPESWDRFAKAGKDIVLAEWEYKGHALDFIYIGANGEPFADWTDWAEGRSRDEYSGKTYKEAPFYGKERPYELEQRLRGEDPPSYNDGKWRTAIWWALNENVMWAFHEDGHIDKWVESMSAEPVVEFRGTR